MKGLIIMSENMASHSRTPEKLGIPCQVESVLYNICVRIEVETLRQRTQTEICNIFIVSIVYDRVQLINSHH